MFGNVNGHIKEAISKANALHASKNGPFNFVILLGNITDEDKNDIQEAVNDRIPLNLPFYVQGNIGISESATNLHFLTKTCLTREGFKIAHSESLDTNEAVDILISDKWPENIEHLTNGAAIIPDYQSIPKDSRTGDIAQGSTPRYHFTSRSNTFWERPPYRNHDRRITRFISLAGYGESKKWFYAFKLGNETPDTPSDATDSPYEIKRKLEKDAHDERPRKQQRERKERGPKVRPDACFFCLSNPNVDKDLIVSIAEESYLALDKGPLSSPEINARLGFNGHVLIIPIGHIPTLNFLPKEARNVISLERKKYRVGLQRLFKDHGLETVSFEISRSKGIHLQTQVIPVLQKHLDSIEKSIYKEVAMMGLQVETRHVHMDEGDYVRFELNDLVFKVSLESYRGRFDFQMCRRAIALGMDEPDQIDWKFCVRSPQEEAKDGLLFKKEFEQYDFSM